MTTSLLGDRLKAARAKAGLTQEALAEAVNAHKFTISKWERGATTPGKPSDYVAISKATGVSITWLRDGKGSVDDPYVAPVEEARRLREANLSSHVVSVGTGSGKTDWFFIANMAVRVLGMEPTIKPERLARVMELGITMASKGTLDDEVVATILRLVT